MDLRNCYFSITSPLEIFDRWLHPFKYQTNISLRDNDLSVSWTTRADRALKARTQPLIAEMQLYFSCVVKKRVIFNSHAVHDTTPVLPGLEVCFRAVPASSCSPEEFARNYPVDGEFDSQASKQMHPSALFIDFKDQQWVASFNI